MINRHFPIAHRHRPPSRPTSPPGSDGTDDTAERAWQHIANSPYRELQRISCATDNGVLVLNGQVSSFYLKQVAQEIARKAEGVHAIANRLEVAVSS